MNRSLKVPLQLALFLTALLLCVSGLLKNYMWLTLLCIALYGLSLLYHLVLDIKRNKLFIAVISLFLVSSIMTFLGNYLETFQLIFLYGAYVPAFIVYVVILLRMLKGNEHRFMLNKYSFLIFLVVAINIWVGYELISMLVSYNLSAGHLWFFFLFTIIKMLLLSLGIIYYLTNRNKHRQIAMLNWSLTCFFFGDLIDTTSSLYFGFDNVPVFTVLERVLLVCGLIFFYLYCVMPKTYNTLEKENIG